MGHYNCSIQLISYYLKRKVQSKPMVLDTIVEVDVYKIEPSDLPDDFLAGAFAILNLNSQVLCFRAFKAKDKGPRMVLLQCNGKEEGQKWLYEPINVQRLLEKKTGEDKKIRRGDKQLIGTMKTLVFYNGHSPKVQRTNWVIHEYCLAENDQGLEIDKYELCRVILKKHAGPLKGHVYDVYAPFSE
ncbi:unnamed protein product [Thlaspi arvense]|uniref:NAC domain-containing protein n=1 Tax=Thlaspi arvense TaxID=13288 RepID=A0AAU9S178_THLAR|nr:unnamed protein product [Thlaspi arvense]